MPPQRTETLHITSFRPKAGHSPQRPDCRRPKSQKSKWLRAGSWLHAGLFCGLGMGFVPELGLSSTALGAETGLYPATTALLAPSSNGLAGQPCKDKDCVPPGGPGTSGCIGGDCSRPDFDPSKMVVIGWGIHVQVPTVELGSPRTTYLPSPDGLAMRGSLTVQRGGGVEPTRLKHTLGLGVISPYSLGQLGGMGGETAPSGGSWALAPLMFYQMTRTGKLMEWRGQADVTLAFQEGLSSVLAHPGTNLSVQGFLRLTQRLNVGLGGRVSQTSPAAYIGAEYRLLSHFLLGAGVSMPYSAWEDGSVNAIPMLKVGWQK